MKSHIFLSFDFGLKRIGVAIGQNITNTARALKTITAKNGVPDWQEVGKLLDEWQPDAVVVGIPVSMDGSELYVTELAKEFAKLLREKFKITVYEADERLTTKMAREELFEQGGYKAIKKSEIDAVAAKLILESWLFSEQK